MLWSSGISRKSDGSINFCEIQPGKGMHFFCFLLFWESFNCCNFGTPGPIQVGFSAKCTSPDEDFNQIENWKCDMFDFHLIPLDRITYIGWKSDHIISYSLRQAPLSMFNKSCHTNVYLFAGYARILYKESNNYF